MCSSQLSTLIINNVSVPTEWIRNSMAMTIYTEQFHLLSHFFTSQSSRYVNCIRVGSILSLYYNLYILRAYDINRDDEWRATPQIK